MVNALRDYIQGVIYKNALRSRTPAEAQGDGLTAAYSREGTTGDCNIPLLWDGCAEIQGDPFYTLAQGNRSGQLAGNFLRCHPAETHSPGHA